MEARARGGPARGQEESAGDRGQAVEIPAIVKRHLGLDDTTSFVSAIEMNVFVWPGPDLRPIRRPSASGTAAVPCHYGYLPRSVFQALKEAIARNQRAGAFEVIKR